MSSSNALKLSAEDDVTIEPVAWGRADAGGFRAAYGTGPQRLMCAILQDAARIYAAARRTHRKTPVLRETDRWVLGNDRHWPFSFLRVCEALDLDPHQTRRRLRLAGVRGELSSRTLRRF